MRRRVWIYALGGVTVAVVVAALALPSGIRSYASSRAAARGLDVHIETIRLRPTRIWLEGVKLSAPEVPGFAGQLPAIEVRFGLSGVRSVSVHGGSITIEGDADELLRKFRRSRTDAKVPQTTGGGMPFSARGLYLRFEAGPGERYEAWGVSLERRQGELLGKADLARAQRDPAHLEVRGVDAVVGLSGLELRHLDASQTTIRVRLDATPVAHVNTAAPSASQQSSSVWLSGLGFSPGRGQRLRARLDALTGMVARRLPSEGGLDLDQVAVLVEYGAEKLNIGPARFGAAKGERSVTLSFIPTSGVGPESESLEVQLVSPLAGGGDTTFKVRGGPLPLSRLGIKNGDFRLTGVEQAKLRLDVEAALSADGARAVLSTTGEMTNLAWAHPRVSTNPLTGIDLGWAAQGVVALDGSKLEVTSGQLTLGAVTAQGKLSVERQEARLVVDGELEAPSVSCQEMFDSLPSALVPLLAGARFSGRFSWKGGLQFDTDQPSKTKAQWRMKNACRIVKVDDQADPEQFRQPFSRVVPSRDGPPLIVWSGPGTQDWVPLEQISRYMELGVLTTEDGGFWYHQGFDSRAIEGSIRQNLEAGRFVRGASTISMQLAKNLYLTRDKRLSRKVQEALLTMLLEQELTKAEILELYLNVIEYGPDVWGIRMAADHYFNAKPWELSIAQAFFLASLLPNPLAQHFESDGSLKAGRRAYIQRLLRIAHGRGRLTASELEEGLAQGIQFGVPHLRADDGDDSGWDQGAEIPGP